MPLSLVSQPVNVYGIGYTMGQKEIVLLQSHGVYAIDIKFYFSSISNNNTGTAWIDSVFL